MFQDYQMGHISLTYSQIVKQQHKALLKIRLMNRLSIICLFLICFNSANAQIDIINSPELISSAGGNLIQDNYNLCFSLGEIAIETFIQTDIILTQGFQQENYQISALDETFDTHTITLYPNPTQDILHIDCNIEQSVDLVLKDIKGSEISTLLQVDGMQRQNIYLNQFSQGIYFLEVRLNNKNKQVYKIQKLN